MKYVLIVILMKEKNVKYVLNIYLNVKDVQK